MRPTIVDRERYARQGLMPELPPEAQERLRANRVLVLGAGGLGAPILYYLTAVGVGSIRLVDDDVVSVSNLNRQILFAESDLGKPKAECARTRLLSLNSTTHIDVHAVRLTADNAHALASDVDLIIDASETTSPRATYSMMWRELSVRPISMGQWRASSDNAPCFISMDVGATEVSSQRWMLRQMLLPSVS